MEPQIQIYDGHELWLVLSKHFLKKMEFILEDKIYRSGIFQNYKTVSDQYRIKFKGDIKVMVLPVPYQIIESSDMILLDYRAKTLFHDDQKLINTLKKVKKNDASIFFDRLLKVKIGQ